MTPGPWMVEQGRAARVRHPGPGGPHLPPPLWLCPVSSLPLSRTVCKHRCSPRLEPKAKFTVCGIYKQPASRPQQKRLARTRAPRRGPASDLAPAARRPVPCSRDWRPGLWCCSVAMATALRGGPSSQLPFIPGRGEERGCWNCSFSLFFFLCCDLDEQSLKCSPAIFLLPALEDIRMLKGCPEEVLLAQPSAPTPTAGPPMVSGAGQVAGPSVAGAAPVTAVVERGRGCFSS